MHKIVFLASAIEDIQSARDWYDDQRVDLGRLFVRQIDQSLIRIKSNPSAYPIKFGPLRAKLLKSFPHSIFYRIESNKIIRIYACLHHRQHVKEILESR